VKNRVTCDARKIAQPRGYPVGSLLVLKNVFPIFSPFFRISRNHISVDFLELAVMASDQNPAVNGGFEPILI
jgi:hypothetical protein